MPQFLAERPANRASSIAAQVKQWVSDLFAVDEDAT
jgi:hypothetical protein